MFLADFLFGQVSDEILICWSALLLVLLHGFGFSHSLLYQIRDVHKVHILPITLMIMCCKSRTRSEILLVVLTEFGRIKEARILHAYEGVVLEHRVEIKGLLLIRPLECLSLELLLKLGTEDPVEIFKVCSSIVGSMSEIDVIVGELSVLSGTVTIIIRHVILRINLVTQVDS